MHRFRVTLAAIYLAITPLAAPAEETPEPETFEVIPMEPAELEGFVGTYKGSDGTTFRIRLEDAQLLIQRNDQPFLPIYPHAKNLFHYEAADARLEFLRDSNDRIAVLVFHQDGGRFYALKIRDA